ncbi:MAG: hypothetical protein Q4D29_08685 [Lachnospiraceae bacterium]|nr:hypothetical protein [Lachnospiraceae bacterium]
MKNPVVLLLLTTLMILSGCKNSSAPQFDSAQITESPVEEDHINDTEIPAVPTDSSSISPNITYGIASDEDRLLNSEIRVICYGTSMVYGTGGGGVTMSDVIKRISGADAINYGGYAENTNCIAARSGANKLTLTSDVTIPPDETPVEIYFESEFGQVDLLLINTDSGLNPVKIGDITGKLTREDDHFYFTRLEPGDEEHVSASDIIIPYSVSRMQNTDIIVIWASGNDYIQNSEETNLLIEKMDKMIAFNGNDKYIIISKTNKGDDIPETDEINKSLKEHYGNHFIDLREYLMSQASSDLGYPLDEDDMIDISEGLVPRCFRADNEHGNSLYYFVAGQQVYKKCQELGYLK